MELHVSLGHRDNEPAIETIPREPLQARFRRGTQLENTEYLRQALKYSTIAREVEFLHGDLERPVGFSDIVKHFMFDHEEGIKSCDRAALVAVSAKIDCLVFVFNKTYRRDYGSAGHQDTAPWEAFLREAGTMFDHCSIWTLIEFISDQLRVAETMGESVEYALFVLGCAWPYYKDRNLSLYRHESAE